MSVHTHVSKSSWTSRRSSSSIATVNARAKAEAAWARAAFAQKEIEMRVKQAELKVEETRLDGTLKAFHQQCNAEAALAEANVYEAPANENRERALHSSHPLDRTREYVKDQFFQNDTLSPHEDTKPYEASAYLTFSQLKQEVDMTNYSIRPDVSLPHQNNVKDCVSQSRQCLTVHDPSPFFRPQIPSQENSSMSDLTRFLARCELLTGGLTRFSDKPGNCWAWKYSFENVIQGLHLLASEELDLLTKWLGDESSQHAKYLRAHHTSAIPPSDCPKCGRGYKGVMALPRPWKRLCLIGLNVFPEFQTKTLVYYVTLGTFF